MTEGEAQVAVAGVALDRLQTIHDELPPSPDREAMWAHEIQRDVATEVYGVIESVLVDEVRPAIEYLEAASRVTVKELRERFEDERRGHDD